MSLVEQTANVAIAQTLSEMCRNWSFTAELTGQLVESPSLQLDILGICPGRSPIAIENEYLPARTVEKDALSRIGKTLRDSGDMIGQVIAVRSPTEIQRCKTIDQAKNLINSSTFDYSLTSSHHALRDAIDDAEQKRFPSQPGSFINGSIQQLAKFVTNVGNNAYKLDVAVAEMEIGVQHAITIFNEIHNQQSLKKKFSNLFMQSFSDQDFEQGLGIAATVLINATLFQQRLAAVREDIMSMHMLDTTGDLQSLGLLDQWRKILEINYWPIFHLAISVLQTVSNPYVADRLVRSIAKTTQKLTSLGVVETHDICGVIFQRFITERKYLASYYTRPESAALLAHLAVPQRDWADPNVIRQFKFSDFACGTGTLVHGVYQRIVQLSEVQGGLPEAEHAHLMEKNITAADIVPSAAHLTATLLSSLFPDKIYSKTRVAVPQYGKSGDRVALGSLELLGDEISFDPLFPLADTARFVGSKGEERKPYEFLIAPRSQDLVIMNPPFTRVMSDWIKGDESKWKPFNALGNTVETQQQMRSREKLLVKDTLCYNGYQSMPSAFCAVGHRMLKNDGILALVLPSTAMQGVSWSNFREMLSSLYSTVLCISISGRTARECSWSADTDLAEVLIVAEKAKTSKPNPHPERHNTILVSLFERPQNTIVASEIAEAIRCMATRNDLRSLGDGPLNSTPLMLGGVLMGEVLLVPTNANGFNAIGVRNLVLAQFAFQISQGLIWFPEQLKATVRIPINPIQSFASVGYAANNIANNKSAAFTRISNDDPKTYPMLWRNSTGSQKCLILRPDHEGRIRPKREEKAHRMWAARSRTFIAAEIGYQSQSLVSAYTRRSAIGGRGWPNVVLRDRLQEKAFVLWGNTTIGIVSAWFHWNSQQVRRGILTVTGIAQVPWLDTSQLTSVQLKKASEMFDEFSKKEFRPLCEANSDSVRIELDHRFLVDVLGVSEDVLQDLSKLRDMWCSEPSVKKE